MPILRCHSYCRCETVSVMVKNCVFNLTIFLLNHIKYFYVLRVYHQVLSNFDGNMLQIIFLMEYTKWIFLSAVFLPFLKAQ